MTSKDPGLKISRVAVIDDHEVVRRGIVQYVHKRDTLELAGEGANAAEALKICEECSPDLVVLDYNLPDRDGLSASREIRWNWPHIKVLILTGYIEELDLEEVTAAGAAGVLTKMCSVTEIDEAIHAVLEGRELETPSVYIERAIKSIGNVPPEGGAPIDGFQELTERETEVVRQLALGQTNKEISKTMEIGESSVATHIKRIYSKMEVTTRHGSGAKALRLGLIQ